MYKKASVLNVGDKVVIHNQVVDIVFIHIHAGMNIVVMKYKDAHGWVFSENIYGEQQIELRS
jgi:hypothetical protein